ncbi:ATP-binding cassette sub- G member 2 [Phlyctochytrium planicorne]|nr:ATP-binding cassette sub- G member 2 [Phlyctochytrium planicorne]
MSRRVAPEQPHEERDHKVDVKGESSTDAAYFSFKDVWASVKQGGKEAQVLENVSGFCAGKSSLLDTLGFRKTVGKWGGDIRLNGTRCSKQHFIQHSGYVTSDEVEIAGLTVQETLTFAANLRLPCCLSSAERQKKIQDVLEDMHLTHRATTKVGSISCRGLSTGERKRLSIAIELLTVTSVLFLDEPTTGLDSNTGREVITRILEASKRRQLATVMTIHQPSYQILQQFDRLLLLAKGRVCYFGPTLDAIQYFENLNVKIIGNPAEVYAEILAEKPMEMAEAYLQSDLYKENLRKLENIHSQLGSVNLYISAAKNNKPSFLSSIGFWQQAPLYKQMYWLLMREIKVYTRDPLMSLSRYIAAVSTALFFGFAFYKLGSNVSSYDSKVTLAFAVSLFPPLFTAAAIPHWLNGRKLYYLQVSAGFYHPFCWIVVAFLVECFFVATMMILLGAICLSLAGWDTNSFDLYLGNLILESMASVGFSLMITMGSSSIPYAMAGFNIIFCKEQPRILVLTMKVFNIIFGGYYVLDTYLQKKCGPFCDQFLKWISYQRGFFKPGTRKEMFGRFLNCTADELLPYPLENLTLAAMSDANRKLQNEIIATNSDLVQLNATNTTLFQAKFAGIAGYGLALAQLSGLQKNVLRLVGLGVMSNFPSADYSLLLGTLSQTIAGSLISMLNISAANLTSTVLQLVNSYSANFIYSNIKLFKLPDNNVCPFANGSQYLTTYVGFTNTDTYAESPESKYQGVMAALAIVSFILSYVSLSFCKFQKR